MPEWSGDRRFSWVYSSVLVLFDRLSSPAFGAGQDSACGQEPGHEKGPREAGLWNLCETIAHHLTSDGSLPPLAASLVITCLCSQMFMLAESLVSPVYPSSFASSLRAAKLESISSAFIRSTIEVRHASFSPLAATALSRIGATSTDCAGAAGADDDPVADPVPVAAPPPAGAAPALDPKIALMIFPQILIVGSL